MRYHLRVSFNAVLVRCHQHLSVTHEVSFGAAPLQRLGQYWLQRGDSCVSEKLGINGGIVAA